MMTRYQVQEILDNWTADNPLEALREIPSHMTPFRLDCCALVEPLAALVYASELITEERHAWCLAEVNRDGGALRRYIPDHRARERLMAVREVLDVLARQQPDHDDDDEGDRPPVEPPPRVCSGPRLRQMWSIPCAVCGADFAARRANAQFCGPRCRQKASRARRHG